MHKVFTFREAMTPYWTISIFLKGLVPRKLRLISPKSPYAPFPLAASPSKAYKSKLQQQKGTACLTSPSSRLSNLGQLLCPQPMPAANPPPPGLSDGLTSNYSSPLSTFLNFLEPLFHTYFKFTKLFARIIPRIIPLGPLLQFIHF